VSRRRRVVSAAVVAVAVPLVGLSALAVLGTFLYDVPYLGQGFGLTPWFMLWLVVAALFGGALALYGWRRRRGRFSAALVVLAVLTATGASVITGRMTAAVERAGADISLVRAFGIGSTSMATPDAEATYSTFQGQPLKLSIYQPAGVSPDSRAPVLFYVHGGGWILGSRSDRSADMRWFADQGWLTVSVDYTLSSDERHLWNVTQSQIGCALAWVARNAKRYGGDQTRLSLTGDSAGGNLAINTAYMAATKTLPSSCGGPIPTIGAVSTLYPVVDPAGFYNNDDPTLGSAARQMASSYTGGSPQQFPQRYQSISSASHLSDAAPPTLMIVGEADQLVPPQGAYRFTEQARNHGVDVELVRVPYADHVFDGRAGSIGQQAYRQLTVKWLRHHGQTP
jgi:acetyl esterase/lipase